jgi:ribose 5-phosphate isomerase B
MKIFLASDHGGFEVKEKIKKHLQDENYDVEDCGAHELNLSDDYPDFVIPMTEKVVGEHGSFGIILGRSGNGELIAANKVKGARAIMGCSSSMARIAREHNDANIIAFGADHMGYDEILESVDVFLRTSFSDAERHKRRLRKVSDYENSIR